MTAAALDLSRRLLEFARSVRELAGRTLAKLPRDARLFQIAFLATLLTIGVLARDFSLKPEQMALAFTAGLAAQAFWVRRLGLRSVGYLSAVITCFGLSILLRADNLWAHPLAAAAAMSAKFTLRFNGKHLFNPANLGAMLGLLVLPGAWVSPGQWGNDLAYACWFVALGGLVTQRARRWDVSWMFLAFYLAQVAANILWLQKSWAILGHQMQSGALLLFAFFMISDPMTIPNRVAGRMLHAGAVAIVAFLWQFALYKPNGLLWALFLCVPLVPLIDRWLPAARFEWVPAPRELPERAPPPR